MVVAKPAPPSVMTKEKQISNIGSLRDNLVDLELWRAMVCCFEYQAMMTEKRCCRVNRPGMMNHPPKPILFSC